MSENIQVKILEVSGIELAFAYVRLPMGKIIDPEYLKYSPDSVWADLEKVLTKLISQGDDHAKIMRQVIAHMEITAPRYWWQQWATYRAGTEMYSGSTMHTLVKRTILRGEFVELTSGETIEILDDAIDTKDTLRAKANLPEGYLQTRLVMCSYQALRRMWFQRRKHRLPEWHGFIEALHELPYCEDLIFVEPHNPWRELWEEVIGTDCWNNNGCCRFCGMHFSENHNADCLFNRADTMMAEEVR